MADKKDCYDVVRFCFKLDCMGCFVSEAKEVKKVRVLSLRAKVQSSALLLMADRGDIEPVDFAVFADTMSEPKEVTDWLEHLKRSVKIPIVIASKGNLAQDTVDRFKGLLSRVGQPPLHALDKDGNKGMIRRHCTYDYKIAVVNKAVRERLGYIPRQRMKHQIEMVLGISYDEMQRMKDSEHKYQTNVYPLVEKKLRRADCIKYVEQAGVGTPPRSACWFCPYKRNDEWKHLKDNSPKEWELAVQFDRDIRTSVTPGLTSNFFVHRDCVPLDQADLSNGDENQISMMDERDGMCGN